VRALGRRAVQWWPGLCLGAPTGNRSCGKPSGFCPCRGVVPGAAGEAPGLDPETVLQLWSGPARRDWNNTVAQVVAAGYSAIQSQGWYLEDIHLVVPWEDFYANEPMAGIDDPAQQARVLGGETCMWGEYIDGSALLNTVRACGERATLACESVVFCQFLGLPNLMNSATGVAARRRRGRAAVVAARLQRHCGGQAAAGALPLPTGGARDPIGGSVHEGGRHAGKRDHWACACWATATGPGELLPTVMQPHAAASRGGLTWRAYGRMQL
jgi:hypothetical protein